MISQGFDIKQRNCSYLFGQALLVDQADLEPQGFHLFHRHLEDHGTLLGQEILHPAGLFLLGSPLGLILLGNQDPRGDL